MAAGPADDIPTQLAALLGRETIQIRRTDQNPPQASIYDVISAVTSLNGNHAGKLTVILQRSIPMFTLLE